MEHIKNVLKPEKSICHDCQKKIEIEQGEIKNGVSLSYETAGGKVTVFKCNDCFAKSKELRDYQPCEVYSRVVGYLRPIKQWNEGKQEEYADRKEYKLAK